MQRRFFTATLSMRIGYFNSGSKTAVYLTAGDGNPPFPGLETGLLHRQLVLSGYYSRCGWRVTDKAAVDFGVGGTGNWRCRALAGWTAPSTTLRAGLGGCPHVAWAECIIRGQECPRHTGILSVDKYGWQRGGGDVFSGLCLCYCGLCYGAEGGGETQYRSDSTHGRSCPGGRRRCGRIIARVGGLNISW